MDFKYFFVSPDSGGYVPKELTWRLFDIGHILTLICVAFLIIYMCKKFTLWDIKKQDGFIKKIAVFMLVQEIFKNIVHYLTGVLIYEDIPLHLCRFSIFMTLWYAFKPNKLNKEYLYAFSLPAAVAALLFADWTDFARISFTNIDSTIFHMILLMVPVLLIYSGRLKPNYKNLNRCIMFMFPVGFIAFKLNKIIGTNFMFLNTPSPGSPLVLLENLFGSPGYIFAGICFIIIIWISMYIPWEIKYKKESEIEQLV